MASLFFLSVAGLAQAPPAPDPDKPYVMEYYYKTHWGHQEEFLELFKKNHYPVLQNEIAQGRILSVRMDTPAFHMPEQERWDYRVTIVFKNAQAAYTPPDEHAIQLQLFPDQAAFKREEQRRFEILRSALGSRHLADCTRQEVIRAGSHLRPNQTPLAMRGVLIPCNFLNYRCRYAAACATLELTSSRMRNRA